MLSYTEFLNEINDPFDEDNVGFRNHMLELFMPLAKDDKKVEEKINQIITTFCVAINKKLRFDEDIIKDLAKLINMDFDKLMDKLEKETKKYYEGFKGNLFGM